ncbi:MAG: diacylglycerol kinase family protein [Planctomycetota bacterium]
MNKPEIKTNLEPSGSLPESAGLVIVSANPTSGASDQRRIVSELVSLLEEKGYEVLIPDSLEKLQEQVRNSQEAGNLRTVVAAGGDGTIGLLANLFRDHVPFTILPLGTENLLAKYLQIECNPETVANSIEKGLFVDIDTGLANGKRFLVMASCGFDADVVKQVHEARKGHINHWSYARPILNSIGSYNFPPLKIETEDGRELESKWAFIFNVPRYAMNLPLHAGADTRDGKLDLCTFRAGKLFRGLFYLFGVFTRQHFKWKDYQTREVTRIRITSEEPVEYQLDGDPGGQLPVDIEVMPRSLRLVVPEAFFASESGQ